MWVAGTSNHIPARLALPEQGEHRCDIRLYVPVGAMRQSGLQDRCQVGRAKDHRAPVDEREG
jgi:hypothetical protein